MTDKPQTAPELYGNPLCEQCGCHHIIGQHVLPSMSKEWCMSMAKLEEGHEVGVGIIASDPVDWICQCGDTTVVPIGVRCPKCGKQERDKA